MELHEKLNFILRETNPWWKADSFTIKGYCERDIHPEIAKFLPLPQIIALVGLRRTGKTTMMLKIIEEHCSHVPPTHILYFSFDDFSELDLEDLLHAYRRIHPDIDLDKRRFLFCFDEIQKLRSWTDKIKRIYDRYKNIKIVVSGSGSLFLRKDIKESLGGRIFEFRVNQLNFMEYLAFSKRRDFLAKPQLYPDEILCALHAYMKTNGFPELVNVSDDMVIREYLKETVVDKILYKDIPQLFGVRNAGVLGEILDLIMFQPGQIIDVARLSKELGLSRQAVASYLDYLEKAFLIRKLYNFSRNLRKQKRALKKYYPAIVFAQTVEDKFALCFENILVWQLDAQFFYRDAYKNEVDIVLVGEQKNILPVEVKTGDVDLKGLKVFMQKNKLEQAAVVTLDKSGQRDGVTLIPFWQCLKNVRDKKVVLFS
jgi:predicted AAA+ superfamily ATPase